MKSIKLILLVGLLAMSFAVRAEPVGAAFTYQGELKQLGEPANGSFDFQFELFDVEFDGDALTAPVLLEDVNVQDGVFTVELNFGSAPFTGTKLWLAIAVRGGASDGEFSALTPRQLITATPYAVKALSVTQGAITSDHIDPSSVQQRVEGACDEGSAIRAINADGSVVCAPTALGDLDGDGFQNAADNCPFIANPGQEDADGDVVGDVCDNCPAIFNPGNADSDADGIGDACDGDNPYRSCDAVAQTGCNPDEKCALVDDDMNPGQTVEYCRPDGSVPLGAACTFGPAGGDDCLAGAFCDSGVCAEICSVAPDSCPDGFTCAARAGFPFEMGVCKVNCDPLSDTTGCPGDEACYILASQGITQCFTVDTPGTQGDACQYINSCASGYGCLLVNSPVDPTGLDCAFICDASQSGGPACADGPGASYTCVEINAFYSDINDLPDTYGLCVDPVEWDEDGDGVLDHEDQCPGTPAATEVDANGCPL